MQKENTQNSHRIQTSFSRNQEHFWRLCLLDVFRRV